ncbi:MAG: hypothetical protein EB049_07090, partial [Actinobacteria bacterium]|nr:hypothetical protein [Actinomycetota bacterium]
IASSSLLIGGPNNTFIGFATSSLNISTTNLTEGSNLFFTNTRFDNRLSASSSISGITTLPNLSLPSSQLTGFGNSFYTFFSATTTDALAQGSTNKYYNDTLVNTYINGSSTIPKTYTSNTFTNANAFNSSFTLGTLNGPLQANNGLVTATTSIGVVYGGTGLTIAKGGTGQTSFGQGWLSSNGAILTSSTSPTVNYIIATSTTVASIFPYASTTVLSANDSAFFATSGVLPSVFIGTTTPAAGVKTVIAAGSNPIPLLMDSTSATGMYTIYRNSNIDMGYIGSASILNSGTLTDFSIRASQNLIFSSGVGEDARISTTGNFGIGTTSPWRTLSVNGSSDLGNNALAGNFTATSTVASIFPYASTTALTVSSGAFFPSNGVWNSSGFVGIGTTSPYAALSVAGASGVVANV